MSEQKEQPEATKPEEKDGKTQESKDESLNPTDQGLVSDGGGTPTDNSGGTKSALGFHVKPS